VRFEVYDANLNLTETAEMTRDDATGVWSRDIDANWVGGYYKYEVVVYHPITRQVETFSVSDPYATSLSTNSTHTHLIDVMTDPSTLPPGWDSFDKPVREAPEDISIYELHVRDFSISDPTVAEGDRGKFTAFQYNGVGGSQLSAGMEHLINLGNAGLTHVHLLPAFDIATIDEDPTNRVEIDDGFDRLCSLAPVPAELCTEHGTTSVREVLATFGPADPDAQMIIGYMRDLDGFNWGYDPFHYSAPEGSYSTNPMGSQRILEFRQMVQSLADVGLSSALDVVYNHTNASGTGPRSVLDKVVPWYYHRLDAVTGIVVKETCCDDTATENRMMEKLMIDSVVFWAKAYKLDAFRFDLMGYHLRSHMVALRAALDALTIENDGVDGEQIYVYGEGWNPGGQGNSRGTNATQLNLDNTGIGTFSDRLRDAARGGGPFDSGLDHVLTQGWLNGISYDPNDPKAFSPNAANRNPATDASTALQLGDALRVGLAGALRRYRFLDRRGFPTTGDAVQYGTAPAGYTSDPEEVVTYVEKHDNETLFDISNYKNPLDTSMADRVRVQNLGISLVSLGQGVPFYHAGMDLLRSKSMDRNSFNSGDWFNTIDWTGATTNFKKGLPQIGDNQNNWPFQTTVLETDGIAPDSTHTLAVAAHMREMLQIRTSSPLFRLRTAAAIQRRLTYFAGGTDQVAGLVAMGVTDGTNCANSVEDIDPNYDSVLAIFNANDEPQTVTIEDAAGFTLHPVLASTES
ncbi:MAG: pullulanase-type alpha-1,6-glucosidase, partial [Myxococcota bacterium]